MEWKQINMIWRIEATHLIRSPNYSLLAKVLNIDGRFSDGKGGWDKEQDRYGSLGLRSAWFVHLSGVRDEEEER